MILICIVQIDYLEYENNGHEDESIGSSIELFKAPGL